MPAPSSPPTAPQSVPELLRILDVASALRRERERAAAELDLPATKLALRERLRAAATESGDPVTDAEIDAAIEQFYGTRNAFEEPARSWRTALAHLWVRRARVALFSSGLIVSLGLGFFLFVAEGAPLSPSRRAQHRAADAAAVAQRDLEAASRRLGAAVAAIDAIATDPAERAHALSLADEARATVEEQRLGALIAAASVLERAHAQLADEYEVRVVSRPGERSGIDAYFEDAAGKRVSGYYLIVEAVTPGGRILTRTIHDAELDGLRDVAKWGEQVPKAVYDRIAEDKRADGVVDDRTFARKRRGHRDEEVVMAGPDGTTPLARGRRITTRL